MKAIIVLTMLANRLLNAQSIKGDWQGILKYGKSEERVVVISRDASGGWTARESTPDDGSNPVAASSVTFDGSTIKIVFDAIRATYVGTLNEAKNAFRAHLLKARRCLSTWTAPPRTRLGCGTGPRM